MLKRPLFKQTFFLLFIIGVADFFANTLYLYWTVWWFDMVMHFISGVCVAMAGVLIWQYFFDKNISFKNAMVVALVSVLIVGLMWEVFETYFEITSVSDGLSYFTDTTSDLLLDLCGGILGSIYAHKIVNK